MQVIVIFRKNRSPSKELRENRRRPFPPGCPEKLGEKEFPIFFCQFP
jgi:hypothetical protein